MGADDGTFPSLVQLCYAGTARFLHVFRPSDTSLQLFSKTSIVRNTCRKIRQARHLILITHPTELSSLGDLSYELAKPILEHCSAEQLDELEAHCSGPQKV